MRTVFLLAILPVLASLFLFANQKEGCPKSGSGAAKMQALDLLKNRTQKPTTAPEVHQVADFLNHANDLDRWSAYTYVRVTGFLRKVKYGGPETCNCHSHNQADYDYHLELAAHPDDTPKEAMICEVTRYTRAGVGLSMADLKKLVGTRITVEGYLFSDEEHKQNAVATAPDNKKDWRNTVWEVHPVFAISH